MDLTTALIGLAVVALTILPMVYFHLAQKKQKNAFLKGFLAQAAEQQVQVTHHDVWSHYFALGLDPQSNKLFYLKQRDGKEQKVLINLAEVDKCRVVNTKKMLNNDPIIDRLELVFTFKNTRIPEKSLEFFNKGEFMTLSGELQLIEKWKTIANSQLEGKKENSLV
jgi:hypothetical protein